MGLRRHVRHLVADRSGGVAILSALTLPIMLATAAISVDMAALYTERRHAQGVVDLAALTAASNIANAERAVDTVLNDNGIGNAVFRKPGQIITITRLQPVATVTLGRYVADPAIPAQLRFAGGQTPYNAVKVQLEKTGATYLGGKLLQNPFIETEAVASITPQAMFSVGSRLASLNDGLLNAVLGGLLGGKISLKAMDYHALLDTDINVLSFTEALATRLTLKAATYDQVLAANATVGQIVGAMADVAGSNPTAKLALRALADSANGTVLIPLRHLVDLGPLGKLGLGQQSPGLTVGASAMGLLSAAAGLANGKNQVAVNLGTDLLGLTGARLQLAIGEPAQFSPWLSVGESGTTVRTAQTRMRLEANVKVGTPNGGVELTSVNLPLNVEIGSAEAKLTQISCTNRNPTVTLAVMPGLAALRIANATPASGFADFSKQQSFSPAAIAEAKIKLLLLNIPLVTVNGYAQVDVGNTVSKSMTFNSTEIAARTMKTVSTSNVAQSLTTSLVDKLELSVSVLGLPLGLLDTVLAAVKPPVVATLNGVAAPVDALLYNTLLALGVRIGEADVRVNGASCGNGLLVQ